MVQPSLSHPPGKTRGVGAAHLSRGGVPVCHCPAALGLRSHEDLHDGNNNILILVARAKNGLTALIDLHALTWDDVD